MTRENGYYWVKFCGKSSWELARHKYGLWTFISDPHVKHRTSDLYAIHADRIKEPSCEQPWTSFIQDQMNMVFEVIDPNIKVQQIAVNRIIARDYSIKKDVTQPYLCQQFEIPEEGPLSALCGEVYEFFKNARLNHDQ
jgi:hypothetical protein